jgi:hypothetical protein
VLAGQRITLFFTFLVGDGHAAPLAEGRIGRLEVRSALRLGDEGIRALDDVEGMKLYLGAAERNELARIQGPGAPPPLDAKRYESLLPCAVALDVEEAWTKQFTLAVGVAAAAAATAAIGWYHGSNSCNTVPSRRAGDTPRKAGVRAVENRHAPVPGACCAACSRDFAHVPDGTLPNGVPACAVVRATD